MPAGPRPGGIGWSRTKDRTGNMRIGIAFLVASYVLSQFFRSFLAVMSPVLSAETGSSPSDLAVSSGLWFLAFALAQIPVGAALDLIGPRRTVSVVLALGGGGGAMLFALAEGPATIHLAMVLIGIGCSPVMVTAYFIFARIYPPKVFGALGGATIAIGSLGNMAGAAPLAWTIDAFGWRETLWALAGITFIVAIALAVFIRDPARVTAPTRQRAPMWELLSIRPLWPILPMMAVTAAPAPLILGLWAGPYLHEVFGADAAGIGGVTLFMGLAMVLGNFAYGYLDRLARSTKTVVLAGGLAMAVALALLALWPAAGLVPATVLLIAVGLFGSAYPAIMAHGRAFLPQHLLGRGVSFINMFGMGGAALLQFASRPVYRATEGSGDPAATFSAIFLFFLLPMLPAMALYLFSRDAHA